MDKKKLIAGIVLIGVGVFFLVVAFAPQNAENQAEIDTWKRVSAEGAETTGTLSDTERETHTEGTRRNRQVVTVYCNTYEFTVTNATHTARTIGDDCKPTQAEAEQMTEMTVVYDEENPADAFVKSDATAAKYADGDGAQWFAVAVGVLLVIGGALGVRAAKPKTPEQLAVIEESRRKAKEEYEKKRTEKKAQKQQK